ncbi:MAG: stage III sporulation protein AA [Clostridia bacterium]|nr:stage III sporulation protein AA [Clostridia bacterium]
MEIFKYLSNNIKKEILNSDISTFSELEEIRIRNNKPIILKFLEKEKIINYKIKTEDILETLEKVTENSIYTYEKQIANGFITLPGGHRVGITGNAIIEEGKVINITYISGMNFRIARQIKGCSNFLLSHIYNIEEIKNTLIVGIPGTGKTTILKDLIRNISNGTENISGVNVGVVDERNEIAAMYKGIEQTDLGTRTDVISNLPKDIGVKMLIRSMTPRVIAVDEIGGKKDSETINYASKSGVKVIATIHGDSITDIKLNPEINEILNNRIIEEVIVLDKYKKSHIKEAYCLNKEKNTYEREII